jgi:hypothetical protein
MTGIATFSKILPDSEALVELEKLKEIMYSLAKGSGGSHIAFDSCNVHFERVIAITSVAIDVSPDIDPLDYPQYKDVGNLSQVQFSFMTVSPGEKFDKRTMKLRLNFNEFHKAAPIISDRIYSPMMPSLPSLGPLVIPGVVEFNQHIRILAMRSSFPTDYLANGTWQGLAEIELDYVPA